MGRRKDVRDEGWGGAVGATDRQLYYVVLEMLCRPKANAQRSECAALRMTTVHGPMRIAVKLHAVVVRSRSHIGTQLSRSHIGERGFLLRLCVRLKFWSAHCMTALSPARFELFVNLCIIRILTSIIIIHNIK